MSEPSTFASLVESGIRVGVAGSADLGESAGRRCRPVDVRRTAGSHRVRRTSPTTRRLTLALAEHRRHSRRSPRRQPSGSAGVGERRRLPRLSASELPSAPIAVWQREPTPRPSRLHREPPESAQAAACALEDAIVPFVERRSSAPDCYARHLPIAEAERSRQWRRSITPPALVPPGREPTPPAAGSSGDGPRRRGAARHAAQYRRRSQHRPRPSRTADGLDRLQPRGARAHGDAL